MIKLNFRFYQQLPAHEKKITLSTMFTLGRIILTPFILIAMFKQHWGVACVLFIIASITDYLDGSVARWRGEKTFLGACLDPIADKFLILSCFFTLAFIDTPLFALPKWFFIIVLAKEIVLICGALFIYMTSGHLEVRPLLLGKLTTFVQICFIIWLFACYFFQWLPIKTYYTMLAILLILIIASFVQYCVMGLQWLQKK